MRTNQKKFLNLCIAALVVLIIFVVAEWMSHSNQQRWTPSSLAAPLQQNSSWSPPTQSIDIVAGTQNQQVTAILTNSGSISETFTIEPGVAPSGWTIDVSPDTTGQTVTLSPSVKQTFTFWVTVPATAASGNYQYTLIARSATSSDKTFTLNINVQAPTPTNTSVPNNADLELSVGESAQDAAPGDSVTYKLQVRNPGNISGRYKIDFPKLCDDEVPGCSENPSQDSFVIDADEERDFEVTVLMPTDAVEGTIAKSIVRAYLESDPSVEATVQLITSVEEAPTPTHTKTPTNTPTPGSICDDIYEQDDEQDTARHIDINMPQPKPSGLRQEDDPDDRRAICPPGDEDWIKFAAVGGKIYTIDIFKMADGIDLSLELFDENGQSIAFNDDYFYRNSEDEERNSDYDLIDGDERDPKQSPHPYDIQPRIDSWRAPHDGIYYIRVRDAAGRGGRDLTYEIEVSTESYGPTPETIGSICMDRFEPDGLPEQSSLIVSNEIQENRSLCPTGDADWITFFGKAGKRYIIETDTSRYRGVEVINEKEAGADTILTLTDRDGVSFLDYNDDIQGADTFDSQIEFFPQEDGFYYVQVKNVGDIGNQFIRYDITLYLCTYDDADCGTRSSASSTNSNNSINTINDNATIDETPTPTIPIEEFSLDADDSLTDWEDTDLPVAAPNVNAMASAPEVVNTPTTPPVIHNEVNAVASVPEVVNTPTTASVPLANSEEIAGLTTVDTQGQEESYTDESYTDESYEAIQTTNDELLPDAPSDDVFYSHVNFSNESFWDIWQQTDQPVIDRGVARRWMWSVSAMVAQAEPYASQKGSKQYVQYSDTEGAHINDAIADPADPWFVTFGLLAQELVNSYIQFGSGWFQLHAPANMPLVGDRNDTIAPTYTSFEQVIGTRFPDLTGEDVIDRLNRQGEVSLYEGDYYQETQLVHFVDTTGHNISGVFWDYLNRPIEEQQSDSDDIERQTEWHQFTGYPVTEPYWTKATIDGAEQDVLIQLYQRRTLAFIPSKPPSEQVEIIPVGHYN